MQSDPEYHTKRRHVLVPCVGSTRGGCDHAHFCATCQGYALCPTVCDCPGQEQMVQPGPTMPGDDTMVVYGNVVHRSKQQTAQLTLEEERRLRAQQMDIRIQNPIARQALGLPTKRSPETRTGRPDGTRAERLGPISVECDGNAWAR
jgi:hypothetical protein